MSVLGIGTQVVIQIRNVGTVFIPPYRVVSYLANTAADGEGSFVLGDGAINQLGSSILGFQHAATISIDAQRPCGVSIHGIPVGQVGMVCIRGPAIVEVEAATTEDAGAIIGVGIAGKTTEGYGEVDDAASPTVGTLIREPFTYDYGKDFVVDGGATLKYYIIVDVNPVKPADVIA